MDLPHINQPGGIRIVMAAVVTDAQGIRRILESHAFPIRQCETKKKPAPS